MSNIVMKITLVLFLILTFGCASGKTISVVSGLNAEPIQGAVSCESGRYLWGVWEIEFDGGNVKVNPIPKRLLESHFNITPFLLPPSCTDCLQISVNSIDPVNKIFDTDVTLTNPFGISGYDVRGILFSSPDGVRLLNADDWTSLYDVPDGYPSNPFRAFAKTEASRIFAGGSNHTENYIVKFPTDGGSSKVLYAVDASWPSNCEEPYSIENFQMSGTLYKYTGSKVSVSVDVKDWQDDVNGVFLNAPEITGVEFLPFTNSAGDTWTVDVVNNTGIESGDYKFGVTAESAGSGELALDDVVEMTVSGGFRICTPAIRESGITPM